MYFYIFCVCWKKPTSRNWIWIKISWMTHGLTKMTKLTPSLVVELGWKRRSYTVNIRGYDNKKQLFPLSANFGCFVYSLLQKTNLFMKFVEFPVSFSYSPWVFFDRNFNKVDLSRTTINTCIKHLSIHDWWIITRAKCQMFINSVRAWKI